MSRFFDGLALPDASSATGFAGNVIDRRSEHRTADSVREAFADIAARLYLFQGDKTLLNADGDPLFAPADADALGIDRAQAILLGWSEAGPRLAALVPEATTVDPDRLTISDLRALAIAGEMRPDHLGALAQARALMNWHMRHGFCSNCGAATTMGAGGYRRDCPSCSAQHFPRTDPVVIMMTVRTGDDGTEYALLGRQSRFPPGMYSCLAGFVEPGETLEDAVRRETREEAGITVGRVRYYASQPWPFPSSLMIGCIAEGLTDFITPDTTELEDCRWFSRAAVRQMLAGTHPESITAPMPMAIAHHLIRAWAEPDAG